MVGWGLAGCRCRDVAATGANVSVHVSEVRNSMEAPEDLDLDTQISRAMERMRRTPFDAPDREEIEQKLQALLEEYDHGISEAYVFPINQDGADS